MFEAFEIFSWQHFASIIIGFAGAILLYKISYRGNKPQRNYGLLLLGLAILWWVLKELKFPEASTFAYLPLHLCDITFILAGLILAFDWKKAYPFFFFGSFGIIFALLLPVEFGRTGLLYGINILFYVTHCSNLMVIYVLEKEAGYSIEKYDYLRAYVVLVTLGSIMLIVINPLLGTNFFFVSEPLDYFIFSMFGRFFPLAFAFLALIAFYIIDKLYKVIMDLRRKEDVLA